MPTPPGLHPRHEDIHLTNACRRVSRGTLLTTARKATQHRGTSGLNEHRPDTHCVHTQAHGSATKRSSLSTHSATRVNPEHTMLQARSQTQKTTYCVLQVPCPQRVMAARLCEYTKHRWTGRLERVNCAVCGCAIEHKATCL